MGDLDAFWTSMEGVKKTPSQLQRYESAGSPETILRFIRLGGGTAMGTTLEKYARFRFKGLKKRASGAEQTGYDHLFGTVCVEQKSSGYWTGDDFKWQHVETKHKWNVLLLCGIGYTQVKFWGMDRATYNRLISEEKITNQGNKAGDSSEGNWFFYSDVKDDLKPIVTDEDLAAFIAGAQS
jgi:hypothetical protein